MEKQTISSSCAGEIAWFFVMLQIITRIESTKRSIQYSTFVQEIKKGEIRVFYPGESV